MKTLVPFTLNLIILQSTLDDPSSNELNERLSKLINNLDKLESFYDTNKLIPENVRRFNNGIKTVLKQAEEARPYFSSPVFDEIAKEFNRHITNISKINKLSDIFKNKNSDINIGYTIHGGTASASYRSKMLGLQELTGKEPTPDLNTIFIADESFTNGEIALDITHELTHALDERLRYKNLTAKGKEYYKELLKEGKSIFYVPATDEFFYKDFVVSYLNPVENAKRPTSEVVTKRLRSMRFSENIVMKEAEYLSRSQEIIARLVSQQTTGAPIERPETLALLNSYLNASSTAKSFSQLYKDIIGEFTNIRPEDLKTSLREFRSVLYEQSSAYDLEQRQLLGGGGVNTDLMRNKIRELLEQRLGAIFQEISPEKINAAIEQIISGASRVSFGNVQGKRIRISTNALRNNLNKLLGEINKEAIDAYKQEVENAVNQDPHLASVSKTFRSTNQLPNTTNIPQLPAYTQQTQASIDAFNKMVKTSVEETSRVLQQFPQLPAGGKNLLPAGQAPYQNPNVIYSTSTTGGAIPQGPGTPTVIYGQPPQQPPPPPTPPVAAAAPDPDADRRHREEIQRRAEEIKAINEQRQAEEKLAQARQKNAQLAEPVTKKLLGKGVPENLSLSLGLEATEEVARLKALEFNVTGVTAKVTDAARGVQKLHVVFKDGKDILNEYNRYLIQTADGMQQISEKQYKDISTRKYSPKQLQSLGQTYPTAFARAEEQGFAPESLKKVSQLDLSGFTRLSYVLKDQDGVFKTLNLTVDRFGRVLTDTQRRFRGFGDSIIRNTAEVLKWSIAVSLIYGPMYKLQQLVELAIDNEAKLADIIVAVGKAQANSVQIFEDAAAAAQATGETINGVLEGFSLAYRAAGAISDPLERTTVANKLLTDSLVLSKLSSLDQAEALDVLSGSLRQVAEQLGGTDKALLQGTTLLDKWVAVSNRANVDLATLATAFSITSESAENAGVSVDQLNGIVGALSEKIGGLGGRETGNAVRALIGGVYTESAAQALQTYGIAVTDTTGKMRDFLDIMEEISQLNQRGLISDDQLNKLALTLGGGVRRGQQYLAFLTDLKRVQEIANVSINASGDAQEALSIKLETAQTSITQLGNSFQELAQTLGTKGGILDVFKTMTDLTKVLVGGLDDVLGILGKAGPTLLAAGVAYAAFFKGGTYSRTLDRAISNVPIGLRTREIDGAKQTTTAGDRFLNTWGGNAIARGIGGILPALPSALGSAGQGDWKGAGITLGSAALGTLLAGGNPIGGVIGAAIGDFFVTRIQESKGEIQDVFKPIIEPIPGVVAPGTTQEEARVQKLSEQYFSTGTYMRQIDTAITNLATQLIQGFGGYTPMGGGGALHGVPQQQLKGNLTDQQLAVYQAQEVVSRGVGGIYRFKRISEQDVKNAQEFLNALQEAVQAVPLQENELNIDESKVQQLAGDLGEQMFNDIQEIAKKFNEEFRTDLYKREISPRQYSQKTQTTTGFTAALPNFYTAMTTEAEQLAASEDEVLAKFNEIGFVLSRASAEEVEDLTRLVGEIFTLREALADLATTGKEGFEWGGSLKTADELVKILGIDVETLNALLKELGKELLIREVKLPTTVDFSKVSSQQFQKTNVAGEATKAWERYLSSLSPEEAEVARIEGEKTDLLLKFSDTYKRLAGIPQEFLSDIINQFIEQSKILQQQSLGYQFADYTQAQFNAILPQYMAIRQSILAQGGESKEEPLLTFFQDSTSPVYMQKDWKIVQFLLGQIADNTEKQLEGVFNLPEGANFWFPSSVLPLLERSGGGGGLAVGDITDAINNSNVAGNGAIPDQFERNRQIMEQLLAMQKPVAQQPPAAQTFQDLMANYGIFSPLPGQVPTAPTPPPNAPPVETYPYMRPTYPPPEQVPVPQEQTMQDILANRGIMGATGALQQEGPPPWWQSWLNSMGGFNGAGFGGGVGPSVGITQNEINSNDTFQLLDAIKNMNTKPINFRLQLTSNTQLIVDGRVLANVIKPYLSEDLLSSEGTTGSVAQSHVI